MNLFNFKKAKIPDLTQYEELERLIKKIANDIKAEEDYLPTFAIPKGDATPCIEIWDSGYYYFISEKGSEYSREFTKNLNELINWIFKDVTYYMAAEYELHNRIPNQDFRLQLFAKHVELMSKVDIEFANLLKIEYEQLLSKTI